MRYPTFVLGLSFALLFPQPEVEAQQQQVLLPQPLLQAAPERPSEPVPLKLDAVLREADATAYANRGAQAGAKLARANLSMPLKGMLPSARLEAGAVRTTDPIGTFGTLLRQRRVTASAFQPEALNYPSSIDNLTGAAVLEVPVFNADALEGYRAAVRVADAAEARAQWATLATRLMVIRAYYGAVLAREQQQALTTALAAGNAMTRQIEQMLKEGLVTHSDLLQMQVRTNSIRAQLLAANAGTLSAREQLGVLLGRDAGVPAPSDYDLPDELPPDSIIKPLAVELSSSHPNQARWARESALSTTVSRVERDDLRATKLEVAAAQIDNRRANTTLLPRLNGVMRYDWNSSSGFYTGRPSFTAGIMASWSLFGGASEIADIQATRARLAAAKTINSAAIATAQLEADTSARHLHVAIAQLDLATQSLAQSKEAFRLVQRRYAGGLATVAELLAAEATETNASLAQAAARYALIDAIAHYRLVLGVDPGGIASQLDTASGT